MHNCTVCKLEQLPVYFPVYVLVIKDLGSSSEYYQHPKPLISMPLLRNGVAFSRRPKVHRHSSTEPLPQIRDKCRQNGVLRCPRSEYARHSFGVIGRIGATYERHRAVELSDTASRGQSVLFARLIPSDSVIFGYKF